METAQAEPVPEKKSDKMETDEQPKNDEGKEQSEPSDERTVEPEANGTAAEEETSQKAKGILF